MSPALENGDYVITKKPRSFRPGFIYIIDHIDLGRIIKRLEKVEKNRLVFSGDNPASTPEAVIAPVSPQRVLAQAWFAISPRGIKRVGPLRKRPPSQQHS